MLIIYDTKYSNVKVGAFRYSPFLLMNKYDHLIIAFKANNSP